MAHGLTGLEANLLTELRVGWDPQSYTREPGLVAGGDGRGDGRAERARADRRTTTLTADGTALRDGIEDATDRLMQPVVDAIGDDLPGLLKLLDGWSQQIIEHGLVPARPVQARLRG